MAQDAIETVRMRNSFYKDSYRRVMMAMLLSFVIAFTLLVVLGYMISHPPQPKYFATSINGRITPLQPLDRPNQSTSAVLQWANQAAIASYTYNFVNYRSELQAASEFFTAPGWRKFMKALADSNVLDAIKAKKLVVSAVATGAPIILRRGVLSGRYSWKVQMPILVTYQSTSEIIQERYMVTITITRISSLDTPRGLGIAQFIATPLGGSTIGS